MKNIIAFALIMAAALFFFSCAENKEEQKKKALDIEYLRIIGRAYLEEDRLEEAEETFNSLLDLSPDDAASSANLALVFLKQNKYKEAGDRISKALEEAPENPDIRMISAKYYELNQLPDKAIGELEGILKKNPDFVKALYTLAGMFEQKEGPEAVARREEYLKQTVEKAPANIVPRLDYIGLLMKKGSLYEATAQLE